MRDKMLYDYNKYRYAKTKIFIFEEISAQQFNEVMDVKFYISGLTR